MQFFCRGSNLRRQAAQPQQSGSDRVRVDIIVQLLFIQLWFHTFYYCDWNCKGLVLVKRVLPSLLVSRLVESLIGIPLAWNLWFCPVFSPKVGNDFVRSFRRGLLLVVRVSLRERWSLSLESILDRRWLLCDDTFTSFA